MLKYILSERMLCMKIVHVFVEHPIMHLDHTFTYRCDSVQVCRGVRVKVPFGNTSIIGFVVSLEDITDEQLRQYPFTLKSIWEVIDKEPLINEELFQLAAWMAKTYVAPMISCYQCMLPVKLKPKTSSSSIKMETWVKIVKPYDTLTKKQAEVYLALLQQGGEMLRSQFYHLYKTPGRKLINAGIIQTFEKEAVATFDAVTETTREEVSLSEEQQTCILEIQAIKHHAVILLHGATGSGKTEVFLQLADQVLATGKQVVLLVPEISLTPQMVKRVKGRFQAKVAIYHSGLNPQEKYEQYQLVKQHRVQIVVGTRSAVFMPFDKLGLIIMDEEHENSYKQDATPRYHCRDIAIFRGKYHDANVILASATPSLESYARAYKGVYKLLEMPKRINDNFPKIKLVEMRKALANKESYLLSNDLLDAMYERLQKGEQIILLLNRRGYTPILRCISCGYVQICPHCEVAMAYHKEEKILKCHTCGHCMPVPAHCPQCGASTWRYLGIGTQKLEELVQIKFPKAKIIRMDADTTSRKNAHEHLLQAFGNHQADILIGTQMIAKGLDFENVTLVGIVNGDAMLQRSDYRSAELTYDLLEQASGRSGRGTKGGEVIIQAYDTTHYAVQSAAQHDYASFFRYEMQYRHLANYPPYTYLASILFVHQKEAYVSEATQQAMQVLQNKKDCKVLGPTTLHKIKDEIRMRIVLKGKQQDMLRQYINHVSEQHRKTKQKARIEIDLAPIVLD